MRKYEEVRERIFSEKKVAAVKGLIKVKNLKLIRKLIVAAVNRVKQADNRPNTEVLISGKPCRGLDTESSISLLGKGCKYFVASLPNRVTKMFSSFKTANGQSQEVLGKIILPVTYKGKERFIQFYLCPSFKRERVFATILSAPLQCSISKLYVCSSKDHLANLPFKSRRLINHFRLAWSGTTWCFKYQYAPRHSFSVTL